MLDQIRQLQALPDTPLYNIKVVVGKTGVNVSTLRAWERRYGIPVPQRSDRGHRLYSPRDVAILTWMREQVEQGMTVHQAVSLLEQARANAQTVAFQPLPVVDTTTESTARAQVHSYLIDASLHNEQLHDATWDRDVANAQAQLLAAFLEFDMRTAHSLTNQLLGLYTPQVVLDSIFTPVLYRIGEGWERKEITVIVEHAATNFIRQRILTLLQQNAPLATGPRIVCACVPGEHHELGLLMFSLMLQQHGWDVIYLGQSITIEGLEPALRTIMPNLVCVTASIIENVPALIDVAQVVMRAKLGPRTFVYSGRIFSEQPELTTDIPGIYLGLALPDALATCVELAQQAMVWDTERVLMPKRTKL